MKKYGSWTELAALVLRAPTGSKQATIDVVDTLTADATFTIPDSASDEFTLRTLQQTLTNKTLQDPIVSRNGGSGGTLQIRPDSGMTGSRVLTINTDNNNTDVSFLNGGGLILNEVFTVTNGNAITLEAAAGAADLNLPANTTGTVVVDDEAQTLTSKTMSDLRYDEESVGIASGDLDTSGKTILKATIGDSSDLTTISISGDGTNIVPHTTGTVKIFENATNGDLLINDGTGPNQISTGTGSALTLAAGASVTIYFNGTYWQIIGGSGSGGGGLELTPVSSGPLAAEAGKHYLVDTTGGAFTATLPETNKEGDIIRFSDAAQKWELNGSLNLTIAPHPTGVKPGNTPDTIDDLAAGESLEMDVTSSWIQFQWDATQGKWVSDDPLSPSNAGYLEVEGLTGALTMERDKHYLNTSGGIFSLSLPQGTANEGAVIRISDAGNGWAVNNVTVTPFTGDSIDDYAINEPLVLDLNDTWVQFHWNGTKWITDDPIAPSNIPNVSGTTGGVLFSDGGNVANSNTMIWDNTNSKLDVTGNATTWSSIGTVRDNAAAGFQGLSSNSSTLYFGYDGTNVSMQGLTDGDTVRAITMNPYGGNVGIGTTSPSAKLQIDMSGGGNALTEITAANTFGIHFGEDPSGGGQIISRQASSRFTLYSMTADGHSSGDMVFDVRETDNTAHATSTNKAYVWRTSGAVERMIMLRNGNVGIGTANPLDLLDVKLADNRHLTVNYDSSRVSLSSKNDAGNPESVQITCDTLRVATSTTAGGLTDRLTVSNTGLVRVSNKIAYDFTTKTDSLVLSNPTGCVRVTPGQNIIGITGGSEGLMVHLIHNGGAAGNTFNLVESSGSVAANQQIWIDGTGNRNVRGATLVYNNAATKWIVVSYN